MTARKALIEPRMLTRSEAAIYCGISIGIFSQVCLVQPVDFGRDARTLRWDRKLLDVWLDAFGPPSELEAEDDYWIEKMRAGADSDPPARQPRAGAGRRR